MDIYRFMLGVLAVWRMTHLLQAEDGPWNVSLRLRQAAGSGFWGRLLGCFQCLSLWIAAPPAWLLGHGWIERMFLWLAFSGGAVLLQKFSRRELGSPPALYYEDKENEHVVLRRTEDRVAVIQTKPPAA